MVLRLPNSILQGKHKYAMKKYDLEDRLVAFSTIIMDIVKNLPRTINGIQLAKQLSGSGTSVALHYGEAQSAESRRDFIHKMKIVLKELRETFICLKLISKSNISTGDIQIMEALTENNELIAIFVKSIQTARANDSEF